MDKVVKGIFFTPRIPHAALPVGTTVFQPPIL
jgi:hypothetical protein